MKKGDQVVVVLNMAGCKTASLQTVIAVKNGVASLEDLETEFNVQTGMPVEPPFLGSMEMIPLEK